MPPSDPRTAAARVRKDANVAVAERALRRPMVKATRVALISRRIIERISPVGLDAMLRRATRLSEGDIAEGGHFYGSTMFSVDLSHLGEQVSESCDVSTAARVAELIAEDKSALGRFAELARAEALRIAERPLRKVECDVRVRADGCSIHVDVDVEARA